MAAMPWTRTAVLAVALFLIPASLAHAATAAVEERDCDPKQGCDYEPVFNAAPGETNNVTVTDEDHGAVLFTDTSATITPGRDCAAVDDHNVRCSSTAYTNITCCADVNLGDGNDTLSGPSTRNLYITAGTGNDTVHVLGYAVIDGGGGRDVLEAGRGFISDGDDGSADRPFDADSMQVDDGHGVLSYEKRTTPVTVDLGTGVAGGPGESDQVSGFTIVRSGSGDDMLRAGNSPVTFLGGGGNDVLIGSPWKDHLYGQGGADTLDGGAGDDTLEPGNVVAVMGQSALDGARDVVTCGDGNDLIDQSSGDAVAGDCERVALVGLSGGASDAFVLHFPPSRPTALLVGRRSVCRPPEVETLSVRLEQAAGRYKAGTLLGQKISRCKLSGPLKAGLHLSRAGQRVLASTTGALPVLVRASYKSLFGTRAATFYALLREAPQS